MKAKSKLTTATAYCFQGGAIGFTSARKPAIPKGALPIATGPRRELRAVMDVCARHSYDGKTLLVPGLPEIKLIPQDPVKVLIEFRRWVRRLLARKISKSA